MTRHLVVVGNGMVGHRLVTELRERDTDARWRVTVLAEEPRPAYDRVALSSYAGDWHEARLRLPGAEFDGDGRVSLRLGEAAASIDPVARRVTTTTGARIGYDALVLATGSRPFVPPVPGHDLRGCFVYRTIDDLDALRAAAGAPAATSAGVVVGGGLLGLEAADVLRRLGRVPQVVELGPHLMPLQLDEGGAALLDRMLADLDVVTRCGVGLHAVTADAEGRVAGVRLADGSEIATDLVVFSAGVRPRDELARAAGLALGPRGGVAVDAGCRTSAPDVYAIGECASVGERVYGLVAPGYTMASVVADRLLGGAAAFANADTATKLKLLGVEVASFGDAHGTSPASLSVVVNDPVAGTYAKLVVSDDARTLLGGVLVGDASRFTTLRALVGAALPGDPLALIAPAGAATEGALGVGALPAEALICSCRGVTKRAITTAVVDAAATDIAAIKACTGAGTGCGSCVPTLGQLLSACGVTQSKALCEHFGYSRAELFEIISTTGPRTFSELVAVRGRGRGCDICKPAI